MIADQKSRIAPMAMLSVSLGLFALGTYPPSALRAEPQSWVFPVRVHFASEGSRRLAAEAWFDLAVTTANRVFAPHSVQFEVTEELALDEAHSRLDTFPQLRALQRLGDGASIDVFILESIRIGDPEHPRLGLCSVRSRILAISSAADTASYTLTHELGHYFGNAHSWSVGNVMFPYGGRGELFARAAFSFDATQGARIVASARGFTLTGEPAPLRAW